MVTPKDAARLPPGRRGMVGAWIAAVCAAVASGALLIVPFGMSASTSVDSTGRQVETVSRFSLLENEGWSVAVVLAVPVVIALVGVVLAATQRSGVPLVIAAGLLWAFTILGLLSIGLYFLPAAVAMTVAALRR